MDLRSHIADVPDFPEPGIVFRDVTPLLANAAALGFAVDALTDEFADRGIQCVIAAEARGFLLGPALAVSLGAGFLLARKPGKLPRSTIAAEYALEYGSDRLEVHADLLPAGTKVLVHDDLLATGGTASALCRLVEDLGGEVVACSFLAELVGLDGRAQIASHEVHSLVRYD